MEFTKQHSNGGNIQGWQSTPCFRHGWTPWYKSKNLLTEIYRQEVLGFWKKPGLIQIDQLRADAIKTVQVHYQPLDFLFLTTGLQQD